MPKLTIKGNKKYINRMFSHLREEHPSTRKSMSKNNNGNCMIDPLVSNGTFQDPNQLFQMPSFGNLNFLMGKHQIHNIVIQEARSKKQIIYGARAMNRQLPLFFQRTTEDYDIYTKNPKQTANRIQIQLDKEIAGGGDEFYSKPAIHPGTHKVMHIGEDMRKNTKDDVVIADYTRMPTSLPVTRINGLRYETLSHIKERKKEILKDPESAYRHEKDTEDLERIELSRTLRGGI